MHQLSRHHSSQSGAEFAWITGPLSLTGLPPKPEPRGAWRNRPGANTPVPLLPCPRVSMVSYECCWTASGLSPAAATHSRLSRYVRCGGGAAAAVKGRGAHAPLSLNQSARPLRPSCTPKDLRTRPGSAVKGGAARTAGRGALRAGQPAAASKSRAGGRVGERAGRVVRRCAEVRGFAQAAVPSAGLKPCFHTRTAQSAASEGPARGAGGAEFRAQVGRGGSRAAPSP